MAVPSCMPEKQQDASPKQESAHTVTVTVQLLICLRMD